MKEKLKTVIRFILNPHLLLCFLLAWLITNGWAYAALAVGSLLEIGWLAALGGAYLAFLWIPITPEKIVTLALSIVFLRVLFPKDEKTLLILRQLHQKAKNAVRRKKKKKAENETENI